MADAPDSFELERARMVNTQLRARDIRTPAVIDAMRRVPRHLFIPDEQRGAAYEDHPVCIGLGQTISQPYIVAFMTQALDLSRELRVLEIGTGSGYQTAVLAELARDVYSVEIVPEHAAHASQLLQSLGYTNVRVRHGNGFEGWPEHAPYDRIIVTAAPEHVPPALLEQLKVGGLMAIPVGAGSVQDLRVLRRTETGVETVCTLGVRFVPMTGG